MTTHAARRFTFPLLFVAFAAGAACEMSADEEEGPGGGGGKADSILASNEQTFVGTDGEIIRFSFDLLASSGEYRPRLMAHFTEIQFETDAAIPFTGAPIDALFVLSAPEKTPGAQRIVTAACEQSVIGGYLCTAAEDLPTLYVADDAGDLEEAALRMTVVFDGVPVHDGFDGKDHFVITGLRL